MSALALRGMAYLLVCLLAFSTGWLVRGWKAGNDTALRQAAQQQSEDLAREVIAGVAKNTAQALAAIKVTNTTIYQKTRQEVVREPMDPDCRLPAGWMRNINAARAGGARSDASPAVP